MEMGIDKKKERREKSEVREIERNGGKLNQRKKRNMKKTKSEIREMKEKEQKRREYIEKAFYNAI